MIKQKQKEITHYWQNQKPTLKNTTELSKAKSIECITGYLSNGTFTQSGLYKVTLQDGREILIYQKSEGVTMLQLK